MEPHYRASQFKLFNKTLEDGFFPMIVVDAINHKVRGSVKCLDCSLIPRCSFFSSFMAWECGQLAHVMYHDMAIHIEHLIFKQLHSSKCTHASKSA